MRLASERQKLWQRFILVTLVALGLGAAGLIVVKHRSDHSLIGDAHLQRARAHVQEVTLARLWNSNYGGVYVEKRPGVESNPYLVSPDVQTTDGRTLTLRNPAIMTRELSELAEKNASYYFRLTALKLKNPANTPTAWEREALEQFASSSSKEVFSYAESGEQTIFRYMAPLYIETSCLKCHQDLGYKLGDLRGGISVSFDVSASDAIMERQTLAGSAAFLFIIGLVGGLIYWRSRLTAAQAEALNARAEEAHARFEDLVQSTDGIVWEADAGSLRFNFVSARAEQILGYPVADWYAPDFWRQHIHPDDRDWVPQRCIDGPGPNRPGPNGPVPERRNGPNEFDYRFIARDGRTVWLHDRVSTIRRDGQPTLLRGLMRDVSRRKQAEEANATLLIQQKALLDNALVGIVHLRHRTVVACNPRFEELFGYQSGELIGQSTVLFYPDAETFQRVGGESYPTIARGESYRCEAMLIRKDGSSFWGAISGKALDPKFPQEGSIWIYADVSDRKQAEQEAEKLLRAVEQSPVSIVITDRQGSIEYVNPRFSEVTGYRRAEAIGQNPRLLQSGETPAETYREMWDSILHGKEWKGVLHNRRKNGELFWENATIGPVLNDAGTITHFVAVKEDITAQRKTEEELASYRASLESQVLLRTQDLVLAMQKATAAERAKGEFLTQMSHEIRTPMNAIIGFCRLLDRTALDLKQRDYLAKIDGASEHLLELINKVLDLSKIAAGRVEVVEHPFSLNELISRLSSVVGYRATEKALRLDIEIAPAVPDQLLGDSLRLNQVLMNLLANAIKFTEAGSIALRVALAGDYADDAAGERVGLHFEISDTGIGMSADELDRVFEAFMQGDASITRKYGGTGLGLPISRELVALLGGKLNVSSEKGRGTTFSFTLPFRPLAAPEASPTPAARPAGSAVPPCHFDDVNVLLAEDQPLNQQIVVELLEQVGIRVEVANHGQEALDLLFGPNGKRFDLVLMDIQMPVLDGISAMRQIRADVTLAGLPIVAMTAHVLDGEKRAMIAAGANDHLGKPFRPESLYAALATWISPSKMRHGHSPLIADGAREKPLAGADQSAAALDPAAGLARFSGKRDKYRHWLQRFVDEHRTVIADFRQRIAAGQHEDLCRRVHALKGLSGTLGLGQTQQACEQLEHVLRTTGAGAAIDATVAADALDALAAALHAGFTAIAEWVAANATAGEIGSAPAPAVVAVATIGAAARPASFASAVAQQLADDLARLGSLLVAGSGDSCDLADSCCRQAQILGLSDWINATARIAEQVGDFDFDAARVGVAALLDAMSPPPAGQS